MITICFFEVGGRVGEAVDDALDEQERGCHVHDHELGLPGVGVGKARRDERDDVEQLDQVLVAELAGLGLERVHELAKSRCASRLSRNVLQPGGLQHFEP
jgi:hypothetical protein